MSQIEPNMIKQMSETLFLTDKGWIEFVKDHKSFFVKNTKRGDVPPTVIAERNGEVFAIVVSPDVDKEMALRASAILRQGGADSLTLILDAHVRSVNTKDGDEFLKNYKHGDMQRACDEEGACELGIISDCLICQRIDSSGKITLRILPYDYHGEGTEFKWKEETEQPEGVQYDGYIVETLRKIMTEKSLADNVEVLKKGKESGFDKDRILYHAQRAVFSSLISDQYYVFDLLSCRHPEWCNAAEKAEDIVNMLVGKDVLPKITLVALARMIPDHIGKPSFNTEFAKILVKYKDKFSKEHSEIPDKAESFAQFVHQEAFSFVEPPIGRREMPKPPFKVKVWNGDRSEYLGEGTYVGETTVYFVRTDDGIQSASNAEERPQGVPEDQIIEAPGNPKIVLDSGRTVYGCQVWWEPAEDSSPAKAESKWPGPKNHKECDHEGCGCEQ
jgi:hypothetical protein